MKAMNDTLTPESLVPSALVFRELLQIRNKSEIRKERRFLQERSGIAAVARKEISGRMAELRDRRAVNHTVTPSLERTYERETSCSSGGKSS